MSDAIIIKHRHDLLKNVFDYLLLDFRIAGFAVSLGVEFDSCNVRKFLYSSDEPCPHGVISRTRLLLYHLAEFVLQMLK